MAPLTPWSTTKVAFLRWNDSRAVAFGRLAVIMANSVVFLFCVFCVGSALSVGKVSGWYGLTARSTLVALSLVLPAAYALAFYPTKRTARSIRVVG